MRKIPAEYRSYATTAMRTATAAGVIGAFSTAADVAGIAAAWAPYLIRVACDNNIQLDLKGATKICSSIALGAAGYYAGCKVATKVFMALGVVTGGLSLFLAGGISTLANATFTFYFCCAVNEIMTGNKIDDLSKIGTAVLRVFRHFAAGDVGEIVNLLLGK